MLCVILFLSMLIFNYWVIDLVDLNGLIDLAYLISLISLISFS